MPLTAFTRTTLGDLVVQVEDLNKGFSQDVSTVTAAATGTLPMGAVLYRAKGSTWGVTWAPITTATTNSVLVNTNEFMIVIGDGYSIKSSIAVTASTAVPVLGFVREAYLKGKLIKDYLVTSQGLTTTDYNNLKHLLKNQLIVVEDTLV